jgi:hypothetical protein
VNNVPKKAAKAVPPFMKKDKDAPEPPAAKKVAKKATKKGGYK